ncbi:hypothetical protein DFH11DRAFT_1543457 [Phellopilus nigrolimitatus]|nr:hypothetical protein DFH11DRAFT_1543457 [Phellopilus nigrolimitatus]
MNSRILDGVPELVERKISNTILEDALNAHEPQTTGMIMSTLMDTMTAVGDITTDNVKLRGLYGKESGNWLGLESAEPDTHESLLSTIFNGVAERIRDKFKIAKEYVRFFSDKSAETTVGSANLQRRARKQLKMNVAIGDLEDEGKLHRDLGLNNVVLVEGDNVEMDRETLVDGNPGSAPAHAGDAHADD